MRLIVTVLLVAGGRYDVNAVPGAVVGLIGVIGSICLNYLGYCCVVRVVCMSNGGNGLVRCL